MLKKIIFWLTKLTHWAVKAYWARGKKRAESERQGGNSSVVEGRKSFPIKFSLLCALANATLNNIFLHHRGGLKTRFLLGVSDCGALVNLTVEAELRKRKSIFISYYVSTYFCFPQPPVWCMPYKAFLCALMKSIFPWSHPHPHNVHSSNKASHLSHHPGLRTSLYFWMGWRVRFIQFFTSLFASPFRL